MKTIRKNHISHLTSALFFTLWLSLFAGCGGSSSGGKTITDDTPVTPVPTKSALKVTFELKNPKPANNAEFIAVLDWMKNIENSLSVASELHPARNVACGDCHVSDKISPDHTYTVIDESDPQGACGSCHTLEVAAKMPFRVIPAVSLDEETRLESARALLTYAFNFHDHLAETLVGLPEVDEVKVAVEMLGNTETQAGGQPFHHAGPEDLIPGYAVAALLDDTLALTDNVTSPSLIEGKFEAKVYRAMGLNRYLPMIDSVPAEALAIVKETKSELKYKPTPLPEAALTVLASQVASHFPAAIVKTDTTLKKEWEIKTTTLKGAINSEVKEAETKFEFKNIESLLYPEIFTVMNHILNEYPDVAHEFAKFEMVFKASDAEGRTVLLSTLTDQSILSLNGDLKVELKHVADSQGFVPGATDLSDNARTCIDRHPASFRKIKSEIKYKSRSLTFKEAKIEAVASSGQGADVLFDGVVDVKDYDRVAAYLGQKAKVLPEADLDGDGTIGQGDLDMVVENYDCPQGLCE